MHIRLVQHFGYILLVVFLALIVNLSSLLTSMVLAMETPAKQALLVDVSSDTVLLSKNADTRMTPSSMSKLMTIYIVFDRLKNGTLTLEDQLLVSEKAWRMKGSKTFVEIESYISIEDLLRGIIVQSGNDACVVIAEGLAGSEDAFAELMNQTAKKLGMTGSHFMNASGWPDENHYMTARDLVTLSTRLIEDFPDLYPMFSETEFTYNGISQANRNSLLHREMLGVDGLKTGHTEDGGYGLAVSATNNDQGRRLVAVVNGLANNKERLTAAENLIAYGFRDFTNVELMKAGTVVDEVDVWMGDVRTVPVKLHRDAIVTLKKGGVEDLRFSMVYNGPVPAPIAEGDEIAKLRVRFAEGDDGKVDISLYAAADADRINAFWRVFPTIGYLLFGQ